MMKKIIVTMLALLVLLPAFAQTRKVSGVVRDENGDVLAGAIVVVKSGSENGPVSSTVTTDTKGRYTTECKDKDYISFHYLGYTDAVYPVKSLYVVTEKCTRFSFKSIPEENASKITKVC